MNFEFEGSTLADQLVSLFTKYEILDLLMDENGANLPDSRVVINSRFSYLVCETDTPIRDGDMIVFVRLYVVTF